MGATDDRSRRGRLIAPVAALVIAVSAVTFAVLAHVVSDRQERELVAERTSELGTLLTVTTSESRSVLMVAGSAEREQSFADVTRQVTATPTTTVAVVRGHGRSFRVDRSAGVGAPTAASVLDPATARVLARAQVARGMVSDVVERSGTKHAVLALAVAGDHERVAFLDTRLAPATPVPTNADSPFRELNVAVYASKVADPAELVLVSGEVPRKGDGTVQRRFQVGVDSWTLVVSARTSLIGSAANAFPWLVGAGGVLTAGIVGLLIETLVRRRAYAMRLVDERTRQLQEAQREAERANEARESFFASVSHDIRAPLTAITGFTEMMTIAEPEQREEFVQRVRSNTTTLGVMVDNMLDHARLQAGAIDLHLEPLCLKEQVESCLLDLEPVLTSHKIGVTGGPVTVTADRLAFHRVLANVLINAVRYSPRGTPIEVELGDGDGTGRVAVTDRGRGIEEGDLETIFDEFARGSRAKADGGTGLGLFSVHQLVEAQHGSVEIVSRVGEGTTVTIALPLADTH